MRAIGSPPVERVGPWRFWLLYAAFGLVAIVLFGRLINLQVLEHSIWQARAEENYTREISIPAPRGIIYDRNGTILARNVASYNVVITPANLPDDEADIQRIYRELSKVTGVPVNQGTVEDAKKIAPCVEGPGITQLVELGASLAPYTPVKIKCNVSEAVARLVREKQMDWPGVSIEIEPIRDYPTGSLTANIVGFLGPIPAALAEEYTQRGYVPGRDKVGYAGAEAAFDDLLLGKNGKRIVQVDVAGKEIRLLDEPIQPEPGRNIRLTIDTRLQSAAEAALLYWIKYWNTTLGYYRISSGVVIAINPKTGEILAMVSYPSYENNRMARFIPAYYYRQLEQDPRHPLLNAAISAEYPPGSTFKLSTALGALNEGVVRLDQIIDAPGELRICERFSPNEPCTDFNTRRFVDWISEKNPAGFGKIDFLHCIAYSSNVCFYKLGGGFEDEIKEGLGIFRLREYARALGYDQASGIELPGEADGLIPTPQWKRINKGENWSTGDTYIASVGQGYVLATPLQVLLSATTLANYGKLMQPTILYEVYDAEGRLIQPFRPRLKWDITQTPLIHEFNCEAGYCDETGTLKTVQPWVVEKVREGMRLAVTDPRGTLHGVFVEELKFPIAVAGKTGTAEYCDDVALAADRCKFGQWPTHSWTVAFAPFDDPEIAILAFAYNGGEGASVAAPIVGDVMRAYFEIKAADQARLGGSSP
ncbi:MAG: penicillin-binding protein 2 [Anaerolineales bacterium]